MAAGRALGIVRFRDPLPAAALAGGLCAGLLGGFAVARGSWAVAAVVALVPFLPLLLVAPLEVVFALNLTAVIGQEFATRYGDGSGVTVRWVTVALLVVSVLVRARGRRSPPSRASVWFLLLVLFAITSSLWSPQPVLSLVKGLVLLALYVAYFHGTRELVGETGPEPVLRFLLWMNVMLVSTTLVALVVTPGTAFFGGSLSGYVRNPNSLGLLVAYSFPGVWYELIGRVRDRRPRLLVSFLAAAGTAVILLSQARSAWLASALAAVWVLRVGAGVRWLRLLPVGVALLAVWLWIATPPVRTAAQEFVYEGTGSILDTRLSAWEETLHSLRASPWVGSGLGTTSLSDRSYAGGFTSIGIVPEIGSGYLSVLAQLGVVGLALLLGFAVSLVGRLRRLVVQSPRADPGGLAAVFLSGVVVTGVVDLLFSGWLLSPGNDVMQLFLFGSGAFLAVSSRLEPDRGPSEDEP